MYNIEPFLIVSDRNESVNILFYWGLCFLSRFSRHHYLWNPQNLKYSYYCAWNKDTKLIIGNFPVINDPKVEAHDETSVAWCHLLRLTDTRKLWKNTLSITFEALVFGSYCRICNFYVEQMSFNDWKEISTLETGCWLYSWQRLFVATSVWKWTHTSRKLFRWKKTKIPYYSE